MDLWFAEEAEHARLLGCAVRRFGGRIITSHWSFTAFCLCRRTLGVRFELQVLTLTELVSTAYYRMLRSHSPDGSLAAMCELILRDEAGHVAFQRDRLADGGRPKSGLRRLLMADSISCLRLRCGNSALDQSRTMLESNRWNPGRILFGNHTADDALRSYNPLASKTSGVFQRCGAKPINWPASTREMKIVTLKSDWNRWCMVVIYAAAMAWVESAVVFYLRSMIGHCRCISSPIPRALSAGLP